MQRVRSFPNTTDAYVSSGSAKAPPERDKNSERPLPGRDDGPVGASLDPASRSGEKEARLGNEEHAEERDDPDSALCPTVTFVEN